jgi:hypothetical protein
LRYTAIGAIAALAAVAALAGAVALAATPSAKPVGRAAANKAGATKSPVSAVPDKTQQSGPPVNHQPFLSAVHQLVENGTLTAAEGQAVDREILAGRVDTNTLASSGFTQTQLQAVQQALGNAKRALAPNVGQTCA